MDRAGAARYVHLIRAPSDPARSPRPGFASGRDQNDEWRAIAKLPISRVKRAILHLLKDAVPRTFNRICVELWDKTADVLFETAPDAALWELVSEGELEHTLRAPILFRVAPRSGARTPH